MLKDAPKAPRRTDHQHGKIRPIITAKVHQAPGQRLVGRPSGCPDGQAAKIHRIFRPHCAPRPPSLRHRGCCPALTKAPVLSVGIAAQMGLEPETLSIPPVDFICARIAKRHADHIMLKRHQRIKRRNAKMLELRDAAHTILFVWLFHAFLHRERPGHRAGSPIGVHHKGAEPLTDHPKAGAGVKNAVLEVFSISRSDLSSHEEMPRNLPKELSAMYAHPFGSILPQDRPR
jgi:hypothetical protein